MKTNRRSLKKTVIAASVTCLLAAPLMTSTINGGIAAGFINDVQAAQSMGTHQGGQAGMKGGQGQHKGAGGQGLPGGQGSKKGMDRVLMDTDDDSDSDAFDSARMSGSVMSPSRKS